MKMLSIVLACGALALNSTAQTNLVNPAPVPAPGGVREVSLQDCIELALRHNLELQIYRYNPQLSLYDLQALYGAYDPNFTFGGEQSHDEAGSRLLSGGFSIPGSESDREYFYSGLNGFLPWGMSYSVQGNASETTGQSFGLNTNDNGVVMFPFENSVGSVSGTLRQQFLRDFWIDARRLNIRIAKNRVKYSEQALRLQVMQTITTLEQSYYDLIYFQENVAVQQKAVELAMQLVAENRKRVEVGALAPLDEKQAEAQAATTQSALIAARSTLAVQEHAIKQLITADYNEWADVRLAPSGTLDATPQNFNRQDSWGKGLTLRPDLLQAKLDLDRAGIQVKYAKNQLLPIVEAFGTYGYNGSGRVFDDTFTDVGNRDRPFWSYGGQLSVPLGNRTARANYRASKLTAEQAVLNVKRLERTIMGEIDDDISRAQASFEAVASTRAAREYAEAALEAEQKKLESGKSTTYTVLQLQRDLTNARGNEIQALVAYKRNLSRLSLSEGTTFERLAINVDVVE